MVLVVVLTLAVDFLGATAYQGVFGYPFHLRDQYLQRRIDHSYRKSSEIYHHDLMTNVRVDGAMWGHRTYQFTTNSLGFRSQLASDVPLVPQKHRILLIGDSFTEGVGIDYSETFAGHIGVALAEQNVEVLNAAVASYSPIIYWRKTKYLLESAGLRFDELVVFLDLSDIDDEVTCYRLSPANTVISREREDTHPERGPTDNPLKAAVRENTILTFVVLNSLYDVLFPQEPAADLASRYGIHQPRALWTVDDQLYDQWGKSGLEKSRRYMDELHKLLKEHGVKLSLVVYPWPDQILLGDLNSRHVAFWRDWARDRAVPFLDLFPSFIDTDANESARLRTLETYFIRGDIHWNEEGHRAVAQEYLSFVETLGNVPR